MIRMDFFSNRSSLFPYGVSQLYFLHSDLQLEFHFDSNNDNVSCAAVSKEVFCLTHAAKHTTEPQLTDFAIDRKVG
jgi:hypothetical protein